jgi:hypothetical protein
MDSTTFPSSLVFTIALVSITLYFFFPRLFRLLSIGMGLVVWQSSPEKYKAVVESCVDQNQWDIGMGCKFDAAVFVLQMVVYVVGGMCAMAEVESRVRVRGQRSA